MHRAPHHLLAAEDRRARLETFARVRWLVAAASFLYAAAILGLGLTPWLAVRLPPPVFVSLLPLFFIAYNMLAIALTRRGRLRAATGVGVAGDLAAVTLGLYGSGGSASWLWALYPLVTLEAAYLTERVRLTLMTALAAALCYALALWLFTLGQTPPPPIGPPEPLVMGYMPAKWSWVAVTTLATAAAGLVAILALRDARRSLEQAYRRLDAQYAKLRELDDLKSTFLSVVSHELRTPIAILRGYTELVEEDAHLSPESRQYLEKAEASAEALTGHVNMMLAYAAIANDAGAMHPATHRAGELLDAAIGRAEPAIRQAGLVLMRGDGGDALLLEADATHLGEALYQLLANARAATPAGGTVGAAATADGPWVVFEVWDTGSGVPTAIRERLGEPFVQASTAPSEHRPGLGLGLAYAHMVAARHGGTLAIEDREGGGSRVRLRLPRLDKQARDSAVSANLQVSTEGARE